jgi:hypothetical protein
MEDEINHWISPAKYNYLSAPLRKKVVELWKAYQEADLQAEKDIEVFNKELDEEIIPLKKEMEDMTTHLYLLEQKKKEYIQGRQDDVYKKGKEIHKAAMEEWWKATKTK